MSNSHFYSYILFEQNNINIILNDLKKNKYIHLHERQIHCIKGIQ